MELSEVGSCRMWEKFACCVVVFLLTASTLLVNLKSDLVHTQSLYSIKAKEPTSPRVLLYITTHMSDQHVELLLGCWPYTIANSKLVRMADVAVFVNGNQNRRNYNEALLRTVFQSKNITVHHSPNLGYQNGAISAMANGDKQGWFQGYDWVVRVNPDVIIRDDTYLLSTISGDVDVDGVFVDCHEKCKGDTHCNDTGFQMHSDFTAFRPSAIPSDIFWNETNTRDGEAHSELMISIAFASVVHLGRDRWLPGAAPEVWGYCRVTVNEASPVAHYLPGPEDAHAQQCIDWYKERNMTNFYSS